MQTPRQVRTPVLWGIAHGIPRLLFRREARRGRPLAMMMTDAALVDDPRPAWERLRAQGPLASGAVGRVTTSYAVGSAVLRSDDFGVVGSDLGNNRLGRVVAALRDPYALGPVDPPSLLAIDPPDHTRLRRLVARSFTARRVAGMRDAVQARADRLLDELADRDRFDLVEEYAARLPIAVIADLLGVPEDERGPFLRWGNAAALLLDAGLGWREYRSAEAGLREMHAWVEGHLERLRAEPGDDLLSGVVRQTEGMPAEERPTADELRMLALLVLGAGFETTVNLMGNAVALLDRHPAQRERLRAEPALWPNAVEEVLRYDSPVQMTARMARRDVPLGSLPGLAGVPDLPTVGRGQAVVAVLGAMNRDPEVFADPDVFDVARVNAGDHLAFSAGGHFCLGAGLARLEAEVGLRSLYERFPALRLDGAAERRYMQVLRGYRALPVSA